MSLNYEAFCELSEDGKKIEVYFRYNQGVVEAFKEAVNGWRFVPRDKGGPYWTIPKDITSAREVRSVFGDGLKLGDAVKAWGKAERKRTRNLQAMAKADDAELNQLPFALPKLNEFLRPFQRADVAFMSKGSVGNFNEQGLGKTVEAIAAVFESGLDGEPTMVIAPKTSLDTVWGYELGRWVDDPVYILSGDTTPGELDTILGKVLAHKKARCTSSRAIPRPKIG